MPLLVDIITDLVFILLHFFLFFFTFHFFKKRIFQPAVLFSLVWLSIIILHFVFKITLLDELFQLHSTTYFIFFTGAVFFVIGSTLANKAFEKNYNYYSVTYSQPVEISLTARLIYVIVTVAGLPFYIRASYQIFIASNAEDFFSGLRSELSYNEADIGILKYLMVVAYIAFAFSIYAFYRNRNAINRTLLIITFLSVCTYAFFATGRTFFFVILSVYMGIGYFVNSTFSIKRHISLFALFLVFFMIFGLFYGKGGTIEDTFSDNLKSSSQNIGVYMVGSLSAFEIELAQNHASVDKGDNTLRFFIKLALAIGLIPDRKVNSFVSEFVFVPYPTNVFTYYSPYVRDFGQIYAWLMLCIFGAIQTWLFNMGFYLKNVRCIVYFSFLLSPLVLSFFGDQYLSSFSFWLQLMVFTELLFLIDKYIVKK